MTVNLSFIGGAGWQFFTDDGVPLAGGKIYTYAAGTTTPLTTYTSRDGLTPNSNPVILDAAGRTPQQIWATEGLLYKYVVTDSNDVLIRSWDNIGNTIVASDLGVSLANTTIDAQGDALVGFRQSDNVGFLTGSVGSTVNDKLQEFVSIRDFGAVGDGIADDTVAVQAALNSEKPLDWGGLTYRITNTVSRAYISNIFWNGRGATLFYDGAHVQRALLLVVSNIDVVINDLTIDGNKRCNRCVDVDNNTNLNSTLTFNNVFVTRALRLNTFSGGEGLHVRGAFTSVSLNGGGASNCELPAGQGTPSVSGISGIGVSWYNTTQYVKALFLNNVRVEKVYSSDLSYVLDQDGVLYFAPTDGSRKIDSLFSCVNSTFVNCYGRSIKTQARDTVVQASSFTRTEGFASGVGNSEIDVQTGNGNFRDLAFSYQNGQQPGSCVNVSGSVGTPGLLVDGCVVVLDVSTTLNTFASVFPSNGNFSRHIVTNNKIYGGVKRFFSYLCNGNKNYAEISNNYVQQILTDVTSEKALVYVESSGLTTPFRAYPTLFGNVYAGADLPALVRDTIPGVGANAVMSAWENYGFADDISVSTQTFGLKLNPVARLGRITGTQGETAYFEVISQDIPAGGTGVFNVRNQTGCILLIQAQAGHTAYALISSTTTNNTSIAKGSAFEVGNTVDPGTGLFRVWSSGTRQISIKNTDTNPRIVAVFVMSP